MLQYRMSHSNGCPLRKKNYKSKPEQPRNKQTSNSMEQMLQPSIAARVGSMDSVSLCGHATCHVRSIRSTSDGCQ